MKKTLAALLIVCMVGGLFAGCSAGSGNNAGSEKKAFKVGIVQLAEFVALDNATQGIRDGLKANGLIEGENLEIDFQSAQGDQSNLSTIGDRFANEGLDLIFAVATPAAQAMASKTTTIPILATAVTSYESANLVQSDEVPGGNVSGTTDMNPVKEQIQLAQQMVPTAKTIGLIYNNGEANSVLQAAIAKEEIERLGLEYTEVTVTSTNDVQQACANLVTKCDVVYLPTDNTVAASMAIVAGITQEAKIPTICGESGMLVDGGTATLGIDYLKLGKLTGEMGAKILKEGADISKMSVESLTEFECVINKESVDAIGLDIPDDLKQFVS